MPRSQSPQASAPSPQQPERSQPNDQEAPAPSPSAESSSQQGAASDVDLSSPAAVWAELLKRVQSISSFAWVDQVTLGQFDAAAGTATVRPRPGQNDIARFVGPRQRDRLAAELSELLGKNIRVQLDMPKPPLGDEDSQAGSQSGTDLTERQRAIGLPLVKDILDAFPDAVLMDARREKKQEDVPEDEQTPDDTEQM